MPTRAMKHCLEQIYILTLTKGFVRPKEIAEKLRVNPSSITKTLQRLDKAGLIIYNKYQNIALTDQGREVGNAIAVKHRTLEEFLIVLGVDQQSAYQEVEKIEYYISQSTLNRIAKFTEFLKDNPDIRQTIVEHQLEE